jgi:uncharacterized phage protein (TIGR01671 family)
MNNQFCYFNITNSGAADIEGLGIFRNVEKQLSTGLFDKNGKEIWAGDIIGYPRENIKSVVCFGEYYFGGDEYGISGVGFYLQMFENGIKQNLKNGIYVFPENTNEVVGNIYEDSSLLNK